MSKVVFHGVGAGLDRASKSGDANSVHDYVIECGCGTTLVIGGCRADGEGRRAIGCPKCEMATILTKELQVLKVLPIAEVRKIQIESARARRGSP